MGHVFRHPSYYKKLKASQEKKVISPDESTDSDGRAPSDKPETTSYKLPGPRPISKQNKGLMHKRQAASSKRQASKESFEESSEAPSSDKNE